MLYELYHRPHQFLQVLRCALKARVCSNMLTFNPPSKRHPMGLESNKEVDLREKMISLEFTAPKDTCDLELHLQQGVDPSEILKRCDDRFANSLCSGVFPLFLTNVNKQMLPLAGEKVQVESTLLYQLYPVSSAILADRICTWCLAFGIVDYTRTHISPPRLLDASSDLQACRGARPFSLDSTSIVDKHLVWVEQRRPSLG
jgi:hypothetical protein